MKYKAHDLNYKGENSGVHNWITEDGKSYYWHPDWLHIAEDQTGLHAKEQLEVKTGDHGTKDHAITAILKHLNNWVVDGFNKHQQVEDFAKLSEQDLTKQDKK
ncbi:hypothetical protein A3K86_02925 [Photobacterium jeanii]|uniref:Uncharacterized protein n=1 Tax=Photobacterium jeanii TaxID=858640 RepID=A0A178KL86_9GAMM|nr:hypothetical protein [Photobacterium jeanii]OAN17886.1 hypothetical protein A3K86_02925 [Photobacterium jeanii]PST92447.1 hypothetical protein C9I91_04545 [Photobacterium jeanii]